MTIKKVTSKISRRAFLKGSITVAGSVAATTSIKGSITVAGSVAATTSIARAAKSMTREKKEPLVTLLDISKCIGCEECVYACQEANANKFPEPQKPFPKMYPSRVPVQDWRCDRPSDAL